MDPITVTAIVAALSAGVVTGADKVVETALVDAYHELKNTLRRKFGDDSEVVKAVDTVEEDPKADWRQGMLKEKLEHAGADQDPEVRNAAQALLDRIKSEAGGKQHIQHVRGSFMAQADRGSTAIVNIPPRDYEPLPSGEPPVVRPPGWTSRTGLHRRGWEQLHTKILNSGGQYTQLATKGDTVAESVTEKNYFSGELSVIVRPPGSGKGDCTLKGRKEAI